MTKPSDPPGGWHCTQDNSARVVQILWETRRNQIAHLQTPLGSPRVEVRVDGTRIEVRPAPAPPCEVPRYCELLLCIFTKAERQRDRLGDFEGFFRAWEKKFGTWGARALYVLHALWSLGGLLKVLILGAIIDWFRRR